MAGTEQRVTLAGSVEAIRFRSEQTRYVVLSVRVEGRADFVVATGHSRTIETGAEVELRGRWVEHPTYGRQFAFDQKGTKTSEIIETNASSDTSETSEAVETSKTSETSEADEAIDTGETIKTSETRETRESSETSESSEASETSEIERKRFLG